MNKTAPLISKIWLTARLVIVGDSDFGTVRVHFCGPIFEERSAFGCHSQRIVMHLAFHAQFVLLAANLKSQKIIV